MRGAVLVAVGDVEQLQHVGRVVALPLQRLADLGADGGVVVRERHSSHGVARGAEGGREPFGLRLLAALIEALEGDEVSARHHVFERQQVVERLPAADHAPLAAGRRAPRAAAGAAGRWSPSRRRTRPTSRMATRSPTSSGGSRRSRAKLSVLSQIGPTTSTGVAAPWPRPHRLDAVERAVERGPHQLGHARRRARRSCCRPGTASRRRPGHEHAGRADEHAPGLDGHREPLAPVAPTSART